MSILFSDRFQRILFALVVCLTVGFLLYPHYLPMVDLPQHAAQVVALDDLLKKQSRWSDMLQVNWDTPYLSIYLFWLGLYQIFDIVWSAKLVVAGLFLFYIFSIRLLNREFNNDPIVDWVALSCYFGFAFQWGFVGYLAGIPVGVLFFVVCKRWLDTGQWKYWLLIVLLGVASYLSHILTFAFFCFVSYVYFLSISLRLNWRQRGTFTLPYLLFATLLFRYLSLPNPVPFKYYQYDWKWHGIIEKTANLFYMPWNMVQLFYYDMAVAVVWAAPFFLGYRLSRQPERYAPLIAALLIWYVMPSFAFQTAFLYERFALFVPLFYYLVWERQAKVHGWRCSMAQLGGVFFIGAVVALVFKVYDNHIKFNHSLVVSHFQSVLAQMQPKKRTLQMMGMFDSGEGSLTSHQELLHFGQWYQAEKHGWTDYSFASAHAMPVRLRMEYLYRGYGYNRYAEEGTLSKTLDCMPYDYLLVRSSRLSTEKIERFLQGNPKCAEMALKMKTPDWLLFERSLKGKP